MFYSVFVCVLSTCVSLFPQSQPVITQHTKISKCKTLMMCISSYDK